MIDFNNKNKIWIQSMTNTKTKDTTSTLKQINDLKIAGCDLVRVAVFDDEDANNLVNIIKKSPLPIIVDIHFNYLYAIKAIKAGAFKIRLNPGNINKKEELEEIITLAKKHHTWIRIGVNTGSIDLNELSLKTNLSKEEAILALLKDYLKIFEDHDFKKIVISIKSSDPLLNEKLNFMAKETFNYPIHVGVTEAGPITDAIIKSTIGLSNLLRNHVASTIRISISDNPVKEVIIARKLLNHLNLRDDMVNIIACPTCGRLNYDMFSIVNQVEEYCKNLNFKLTISILGCTVNGIIEGKHADIGLAGSGNKVIIFEKGNIIKTVNDNEALNELKKLIDKYYQEFQLKTKLRNM